MMTNNFIEITGTIKRQTLAAILFSDGDSETWIPKSQIKNITNLKAGIIEIEIPEWLAEEKELV